MTHKEKLLQFMRNHGCKVTLGQLLSDPSGIGYKCTSRFSDLRKEGYAIQFEKGPTPAQNTYTLFEADQSGQYRLI